MVLDKTCKKHLSSVTLTSTDETSVVSFPGKLVTNEKENKTPETIRSILV